MQVIQSGPSIDFRVPRERWSDQFVPQRCAAWSRSDARLVTKARHTTALVHVNQSVGRGSTSVDLNSIPVNAIERIEILRDGAAAQYGSDAIAGVINIILKTTPEMSVTSSIGRSFSEFDGESGSASYDDGRVYGSSNFACAIMETYTFIGGEFRDRERTSAHSWRDPQCITKHTFSKLPRARIYTRACSEWSRFDHAYSASPEQRDSARSGPRVYASGL